MSESDGLVKLTEFLKQTKRQAEAAIDILNEKLKESQDESALLMKAIEKLEAERDHFKNYSEQLKAENSTKWRLQERDDWKSLVDSVQKDRGRLQDQCAQLEVELEGYKEENAMLTEQLQHFQKLEEERAQQVPASPVSVSTPDRPSRIKFTFSDENVTDEPSSTFNSPILDRMGNEITFSAAETPRGMTKTLKQELKKAHTQLENERRTAEEEKMLQQVEINRLKEELNLLMPLVNKRPSDLSSHGSSDILNSGQLVVQQRRVQPAPAPSWFSFDYWFASSNPIIENSKIMKV